jgi:serine/threonine protein kinase/tetratricopeptide (TPR) repeat protein
MSQTTACPDPAHLARLLEGELTESEQTELTEHLDSCARCQQAVQQLASGGKTWAEVAAYLKHEQSRTENEPALQQAVAELAGPARTDETQTEPRADHEDSLDFLAPSTKPGSLGRLDHYEVLEVIGRGGMGMVLKVFDEALHRVVAVKVLSPSLATSATSRRRFGREAKAAAAVSHDHVVTIHAVEGDKPIPYLVMQCVAGFSLEDKLARDGPLGVKEILRIGLQTAEGLAAAHKQGLVHRDIKPANILLENGVERVKITDFGLARAVDDASLTQSGVVAGTPQYMSPEQAQGETVDHRSDLFSLGSVLYAMCTGRPPFRASGTMAVLKRVCEDTPRPIWEINPDIPEWLCDIIAKLHAKKPADRFQAATEVADLLNRHLAHLQQPTLVPAPKPTVQPSSVSQSVDRVDTVRPVEQPADLLPPITRNHPLRVIVTAFCIVGLVIIATMFLYSRRPFADGPAWLRDYGPMALGGLVLCSLAIVWLVLSRRSSGRRKHADGVAPIEKKHGPRILTFILLVVGLVIFGLVNTFSSRAQHIPEPTWLEEQLGAPMAAFVLVTAGAVGGLILFVVFQVQWIRRKSLANGDRPNWHYSWARLIGTTMIAGAVVGVVDLWIAHTLFSTPNDEPNNNATVIMYWTDPELVVVLNGEGETYVSGVENAVAMGVKPGVYTIRAKKGKDLVYQESFTLAAREGREFYLPPFQAGRDATGPLRDAVLVMTFEKDTFYEKDGKTYVRDLSAHGNDGVCDNVAYTADGKAGGGLQCKGNGAVWLNRPSLDGSESYTVTAWVRVVDDGRGDVLGWPIIESTSPNVEDRLFGVRLSRKGLLTVASGNRAHTRADAYTEGKWFFLAVTCEKGEGKERNLQIIVDDAKYPFTLEMADSKRPAIAWLGGGMAGTLDEVTVFHHVLSAGELDAIRRQGMKGRPLTTPTAPPAVHKADDLVRWERSVAALPAEEQVKAVAAKLKELNPGFDGRVAFIQNDVLLDPAFDGALVAYVKDGVVIHLALDAAEVGDLSPVRALTGLQRLNLDLRTKNRGKYSDLSPLRELHLKALYFASAQVRDLSPLKDMPLEELACSHAEVSDLSPLKGKRILNLNVDDTAVRDLSPLRGMLLKSLFCRETKVNDIDVFDRNLEVLHTLQNLEQLDIDVTQKNHEALRGLKGLKWINGIPVADFWKADFWKVRTQKLWVAHVATLPAQEQVNWVAAKLKELNPGFSGKVESEINKKGVVTDLRLLADQVTDISPVRALPQLEHLDCSGRGPGKGKLSDLAPLKGLNLTYLDCRYTLVTDLSPLRGMPLQELDCDFRPSDAWRIGPVLRQSKKLWRINNQEAVEFWGEVDAKINEASDCLSRGWKLAEDNKWTEAEAEFKKAVDARPDDPQVWKWRAVIQAEGKRVEQAAADFIKALDLTPKEGRASWGRPGEIDDSLCSSDDVFSCVAKQRLKKDVNLWIARTQWFAHRGKWKEAAKACDEGLACRSDDSSDWFMDAPLRLELGDVEGYRRDCREMLERMGKTKSPRIADHVAKTCLLAPKAVDDLGPVFKLADVSLTDPGQKDYVWYQLCKCLADYRKGMGDESIQGGARGILNFKPDHAARDATALVIAAMEDQRRGSFADARAALKDARARIEANMPKVERGEQFGDDWHDWLRCQILQREAEKLIEKDGKDSKD